MDIWVLSPHKMLKVGTMPANVIQRDILHKLFISAADLALAFEVLECLWRNDRRIC